MNKIWFCVEKTYKKYGARCVGKSWIAEEFAKNNYKSYILLVADDRYDYIEIGSLISIKNNVKDILIPNELYFYYNYDKENYKAETLARKI